MRTRGQRKFFLKSSKRTHQILTQPMAPAPATRTRRTSRAIAGDGMVPMHPEETTKRLKQVPSTRCFKPKEYCAHSQSQVPQIQANISRRARCAAPWSVKHGNYLAETRVAVVDRRAHKQALRRIVGLQRRTCTRQSDRARAADVKLFLFTTGWEFWAANSSLLVIPPATTHCTPCLVVATRVNNSITKLRLEL